MDLLQREAVLHRLKGLVASAREGEGWTALIRGEAGIGKTSVVRALSESVEADSHVLWGSSDDLLTPRPLGPLLDMALVEPDLRDALGADDPNRVLTTLMDLFTRALRPTVAIFEDVHWADGATLDLLTSVGRRIDRTHTLLVMTFRDNVPANHPLAVVLGDLPRDRVESIELKPLSREAVNRLAGNDRLADRVWKLSRGNPFFVTESLRHPEEEVSRSVVDAIAAQVARLTAKGERLVQLASVAPGRIELALLDEIDPSLHEAIGEADDLRLLSLTGDSLAFRHELARTAVLSTLNEPLRRQLHREMLAAADRLGLDPVLLAHHARNASDVEMMLRCLPDAAREAAARQSHREAVMLLEDLEPHLHLLPTDQQADLVELWATEEQLVTGGGLHHAIAAVEIRRQLGDPAQTGASLLLASRCAWEANDIASAEGLAEEAVEVLQDVGGEDLALAYARLARLASYNLNRPLAVDHAERALRLAPAPSPARAAALTMAGLCKNMTSYPDGSEMLVEAAEISESLGLGWELQRARGNLMSSALEAWDIERARHLNDEALASIEEAEGVFATYVLEKAKISLAAGEYAAAASILEDLAASERVSMSARWRIGVIKADLLVRRGDSEAGQAVERLRDNTGTPGQVQDSAQAAEISAEFLWVFNRRDDRATKRNIEVFSESNESIARWGMANFAMWLWLDGHLDAIPEGLQSRIAGSATANGNAQPGGSATGEHRLKRRWR